MSNEKIIRKAFVDIFLKTHSSFVIKEEFTGGIMKTRPDLACFSKNYILMVEVKSDKDNLDRLEHQFVDYFKYSDSLLLLLDISHKKGFLKLIEKSPFLKYLHFTPLFFDKNNFFLIDGTKFKGFSLYEYKRVTNNIVFKDLYSLLWREEKKQLVSFIKGRSRYNLDDIIKNIYTIQELDEICREILYNRYLTKTNIGGKVDEIRNKEIKQKLFDSFRKIKHENSSYK